MLIKRGRYGSNFDYLFSSSYQDKKDIQRFATRPLDFDGAAFIACAIGISGMITFTGSFGVENSQNGMTTGAWVLLLFAIVSTILWVVPVVSHQHRKYHKKRANHKLLNRNHCVEIHGILGGGLFTKSYALEALLHTSFGKQLRGSLLEECKYRRVEGKRSIPGYQQSIEANKDNLLFPKIKQSLDAYLEVTAEMDILLDKYKKTLSEESLAEFKDSINEYAENYAKEMQKIADVHEEALAYVAQQRQAAAEIVMQAQLDRLQSLPPSMVSPS